MKFNNAGNLRLLFIFSYLAHCVFSVGPLGIFWSRDMATNQAVRKMVYISVIDYGAPITQQSLSDAQLAGLARDASAEMKAADALRPWEAINFVRKDAGAAPSVMVALTVGSRVYLASSMRTCGGDDELGYAYDALYSPVPVQMAMFRCSMVNVNADIHRLEGNCGEEMAAILAFNEVSDGRQDLAGSRIVAWFRKGQNSRYIEPCGDLPDANGVVNGEVGCKSFLAALKIVDVVPADVQPQDPPAGYTVKTPCLRLPPQ